MTPLTVCRRTLGGVGVFCAGFVGRVHAQPCDIVDRGSPADGVTTITVIGPQAPCTGNSLFDGWDCMTLRSAANSNGLTYDIEVAWNRVGQTVRGSFVWQSGGKGMEHLRRPTLLSVGVQDTLDVEHEVRSIDIAYVSADGFQAFPRNGTPNLSAVTADVLEYLWAQGILSGVTGHVGSSMGSQLMAAALAHHRMDELLDGVVITGAPFFVDLEQTCLDPGSIIYGGQHERRQVDEFHYLDFGESPCRSNTPNPSPAYDCGSTLGDLADRDFPDLVLSVITGDTEDLFVTAAADYYLEHVAAGFEARDYVVGPHVIFETQEGADAVLARVIEILALQAPLCAADLNGDGVVDLSDLGVILAHYGSAGLPSEGDVNGDGQIDLSDLGVLLAEYGSVCA